MRESERALTVARDWVRKAENDLTNAAHTLKLGAGGCDCPPRTQGDPPDAAARDLATKESLMTVKMIYEE